MPAAAPATMNQSQIVDRLGEGSRQLGLALESAALRRLSDYLLDLCKWNRKINLVASASATEIIDGHFLDSLALAPILFSLPSAGPLLDIGSGAGFPGLVLKTAYPELQVVLVEPRQKRATFLRHIIRTLKLPGIEVNTLHLTPDDAQQQQMLGRFPVITSRALADLGGFLCLAAAFCEPEGFILCMKGRKATDELGKWQQARAGSPFRLVAQHDYILPFSDIQRHILVFGHSRNNLP